MINDSIVQNTFWKKGKWVLVYESVLADTTNHTTGLQLGLG